jgi:putative addiction module component (TIGR02574 family)
LRWSRGLQDPVAARRARCVKITIERYCNSIGILYSPREMDSRIEPCVKFLLRVQRYVDSNRQWIAELLIDELPPDGQPRALDASWAQELERRIADIDAGRVKLIPWDVVMAKAAKLLARRPPTPTLEQRYAALRKKYGKRLGRAVPGQEGPTRKIDVGWPPAALKLRRMHWAHARKSVRAAAEFGFSRTHAERRACARLIFDDDFGTLSRATLHVRMALRLLEADDYVKTDKWRKLKPPWHPRIWNAKERT